MDLVLAILDPEGGRRLADALDERGLSPRLVESSPASLAEACTRSRPDVLVLDGGDSFDRVSSGIGTVRALSARTKVIAFGDFGALGRAVLAVRGGVFDHLSRRASVDRIEATIRAAADAEVRRSNGAYGERKEAAWTMAGGWR